MHERGDLDGACQGQGLLFPAWDEAAHGYCVLMGATKSNSGAAHVCELWGTWSHWAAMEHPAFTTFVIHFGDVLGFKHFSCGLLYPCCMKQYYSWVAVCGNHASQVCIGFGSLFPCFHAAMLSIPLEPISTYESIVGCLRVAISRIGCFVRRAPLVPA